MSGMLWQRSGSLKFFGFFFTLREAALKNCQKAYAKFMGHDIMSLDIISVNVVSALAAEIQALKSAGGIMAAKWS